MSVVIKGMKMPRDCHLCPLSHWNKLDEFTGCEIKKRFFSKEERNEAGRPQFCPLIEIPPHGRLIDADKMKVVNHRPHEITFIQTDRLKEVLEGWIDSCPTFLEAEVDE